MKQQIVRKKLTKNIPLRRRIYVFYKRTIFLLQILVFCFLCLFLFTKYLDFIKTPIINEVYLLTVKAGFKLENVLISGQKNTKLESIVNVLNKDGSPILALNLQNIKDSLEKNPWVKHAVVARKLPNTISIHLFERQPIAIWQMNQKLYLIDDEGVQITSEDIEKFPLLLHVVGSDANTYARQLISDLSNHLEIKQKVLSAVRYGERRWNLNLEQNITVKMPETNFAQALDYISELYQSNKLFDQNYKTLDLRAADKYYIEKY